MTKLGKLVRKRRQELGLSQQELAERSGLPQSFVSRVERFQTSFEMWKGAALAKALEIDLGELAAALPKGQQPNLSR